MCKMWLKNRFLTSGSGFIKPQKNIPKAPSKATQICIFKAVIAPWIFLLRKEKIINAKNLKLQRLLINNAGLNRG